MATPVFRRRRLPHWDAPGGTYFVTSCIAGSISAKGLLDIRRFRTVIARRVKPADSPARAWNRHCAAQVFSRYDAWLDRSPLRAWLGEPHVARTICRALRHFDGDRYDLFAYVVMPSHVHWVFRPRPEWVALQSDPSGNRSPREMIVHSMQTFTAHAANRLLGRTGPFWQKECFDRCVRDESELARVVAYVENNPVKAGLCQRPEDWEFSSAYERLKKPSA